MRKYNNKPENSKNKTATFHSHINNTETSPLSPRIDRHIYNPISICVTASSTIRHNVNAIIIKMKSGKIAKDEFIYRTDSIYKALNLIDNNLARSIEALTNFKKEN